MPGAITFYGTDTPNVRAKKLNQLVTLAGDPGGGSYQPLDSDLTAIAALSTTSFGRELLALADAAASRTATGAAASGAVTSSGLTMATARLLGRTTASAGGVEEINPTGWFTLSGGVLVPKIRGVRAKLTADKTTQNITTETAIAFDGVDFDSDSSWSAGAPTKILIPAGVNFFEAVGQVFVTSSTGDTFFTVSINQYNSSDVAQRVFGSGLMEMGGTSKRVQATTGITPISAAGDYLTLSARDESDTSITIEGDNPNQTYISVRWWP